MSEAELDVLHARLRGGILNKAKRGELQGPLPVGFVYDARGRVVLDLDAQVQASLRHFFATYRRTGAERATIKMLRDEKVLTAASHSHRCAQGRARVTAARTLACAAAAARGRFTLHRQPSPAREKVKSAHRAPGRRGLGYAHEMRPPMPRTRYRNALPRFVAVCLLTSAALAVAGCENAAQREKREAQERSERELAVLLKTRKCTDCYIVNADLRGRDLRGIKLHDTFLHGNLRGADLRGAEIVESGLGGELREIDLRQAKINALSLTPRTGLLAGARFDELDLRTIRFPDYTDWSYAILRGANIEGVEFIGQSGPHGRIAPRHPLDAPSGGAVMKGVNLREARAARAWFMMVDLRNADLRGADLRDTHMPDAKGVAGAKFDGAIAPNGLTCLPGSTGHCLTGDGEQPPWRERHHRR